MRKEDHSLTFLLTVQVVLFFEIIDTSDVLKDGKKMYELLDTIVDEIGKKHVVQLVTMVLPTLW